jgi:DNA-binding MarR family transcriptional regulator
MNVVGHPFRRAEELIEVEDASGEIRIEPQSHAHRVLAALAAQSLHGEALAELFAVKASEISRQTRRLKESGLVAGTRSGRRVYWSLTERGLEVLERTSERGRHDESLLLAVEYRVIPDARQSWALVRDVIEGGQASKRRQQKLMVGSYDACHSAWRKLKPDAESLSAVEAKLKSANKY